MTLADPTPMGAVCLLGQAVFAVMLTWVCHKASPTPEKSSLSLLQPVSEEGDPEFSPSPGLKSLPSTSCIQALFLLVSIPWWDKHVSNQLPDEAAWRAPCSSLQPGIPVRFPCGDTGSSAKGLYGIKHFTPTNRAAKPKLYF